MRLRESVTEETIGPLSRDFSPVKNQQFLVCVETPSTLAVHRSDLAFTRDKRFFTKQKTFE